MTFGGIVLFVLFCLLPSASAQRGNCGSGYSPAENPTWWCSPGWGWSWYDPFPWGWGYPYVYPYQPYSGVLKIEHFAKDTMIFVDAGYAGTAGQLKKFRLLPGTHDIELRDSSDHLLQKVNVHVLPGKTVHIRGSN